MRFAERAAKRACPIAPLEAVVGEAMQWRDARLLAPPRHHGYFELVAPFV